MLLERSSWAKEAVRLYFDEGLSLAQVGVRVGKCVESVRKAILKHGLKPRSRYEGTLQRLGRKPPIIEPNELTVGLLWFGLGDGSLKTGGNKVSYQVGVAELRDFLCDRLRALGLNPHYFPHPRNGWQVIVEDREWYKFNSNSLDLAWLRAQSLQYPTSVIQGFLVADGSHFINPRGVVILRVFNSDPNLLEVCAKCAEALGLPAYMVGPYPNRGGKKSGYSDDPQPQYYLVIGTEKREYNLAKAQLMTRSPWSVKRIPTNYNRCRHLLELEVQAVYDTVITEGGFNGM